MNSLTRLVVSLVVLACSLLAQDHQARTAVDPTLSTDSLKTLLTPLTGDQLKVEADAWLALLQTTCQEIADAQLANGDTSQLVIQRGERITRLDAVVTAFERKGGDADVAKIYRDYASVVGGIDFKDTSALWTLAVNWVKSPEGGIALGLSVVFFLVILIAFLILSSILGKVVERAMARFGRTSDLLRSFFVNVTRKLVLFVGLVIALGELGVDIGPLLAAMGAAGFILGFALQGTLSNFAAGIMILMYRPYDIGHYVTIAGVSGTVEAMTLVSTSVKSPDNQTIIVPNGSIWGGIITNVTGKATRRVDLKFGIGYGDDLAKAEAILTRLVNEHPQVLKDPAPVIKVHELGDSSVNFIVRPWANTSDYWAVYWDLTRKVKEAFDKEGVSIPFPQRDVHLYQAQ
ncbi:MAG: mechanosensitive ion channel family protein [Planctomycetota bacterium]